MDDGSTKEEWKMVVETKKILDPEDQGHATCVRVPVFIGHAEAVNLEFEEPLDEHEARARCCASAGRAGGRRRERAAATSRRRKSPARTGVREPRAQRPHGRERAAACGSSSDNLRKGAALNAVQIAEELVEDGLV